MIVKLIFAITCIAVCLFIYTFLETKKEFDRYEDEKNDGDYGQMF